MNDALLTRVASYYGGKLATHGATPAGVDWSSRESQILRFAELLRVVDASDEGPVLDYGCGYGAFAHYLRAVGRRNAYIGYDIAPEMIAKAIAINEDVRFTSARNSLEPVDFTVASGIFNVELETPVDEWVDYVHRTIDDIASLSRRGFAFNALTLYSDPEKRRGDLYYADPCARFDRCKQRYSRFVSLLHDYPLWEFTILVRLP